MCDSELPDSLRSLIDQFTTVLQSGWENYDVEGLKKRRDTNREYMKLMYMKIDHSDFELLLKYEQVLSDSIEVSSIIFPDI